MRYQERCRPVDRLREQFRIDRLAVGVERARTDALRGRQLVLFDQRAHTVPHRDAAVGKKRLGQIEAALAGRVARVREQLSRVPRENFELRPGCVAVLGQRGVTAQLVVVGIPDELPRLAFESGEVTAVCERQRPVEAKPI